MRAASAAGVDLPPARPRGGYRILTAEALVAAWWGYRRRVVRLADLRVWFAAHEMDARRCRVAAGVPRRFRLDELQKLTGLSPKRLREALRRLQAARLLGWSEAALRFPGTPDALPWSDSADFRAGLGRIVSPTRKVPVPRRILRHLAAGARPALIATVFGHLVRGLYLKSGRCENRGRVKASWIAEVFGVALRRVKEARRDLIASGWLIALEADQWALNRWGAHFRINLAWAQPGSPARPLRREGAPAAGPGLAPPRAPTGPRLAPPDSDVEPLSGRRKDQEPAPGGPAGISHPDPGTNPPARSLPEPSAFGRPALRDVVPEDLRDTGLLLALYEQAVALGRVSASERDRLRFVAAAEHARAIGTRNPCGLFAHLVRGGLWSFLTQGDEDAANARLKRHLHGARGAERPASAAPPLPSPRIVLSEDARLVQAIRAGLARKRYRGDPFPLLKRQCPEWTRERWDRALVELQTLQLGPRRSIGGPGAHAPLARIGTDRPPR